MKDLSNGALVEKNSCSYSCRPIPSLALYIRIPVFFIGLCRSILLLVVVRNAAFFLSFLPSSSFPLSSSFSSSGTLAAPQTKPPSSSSSALYRTPTFVTLQKAASLRSPGYVQEGSTVTVVGIVCRNDEVTTIAQPPEVISMGCLLWKLLLSADIGGLILNVSRTAGLSINQDSVQNMDW